MTAPLERFTLAERRFHWSNAAAILLLAATGVVMWLHLFRWKMNGLNMVAQIHVWIGGGLLVAGAIAFVLLRRRRVAAANKRMSRGQVLGLRAFQLVIGWMVATGVVAYIGKWIGLTKDTRHFVEHIHLYAAGVVAVLVAGHLAMVFLVKKNRGIAQAMLDGTVDPEVARKSAPQWAEAIAAESEKIGAA